MTNPFKPIRPKKISEEIVEQIKALISSGDLKPGERIPSERDMATMLGVSRPSVREALMVLDAMGFVESRQGGGTFVRSLAERAIIDPLANILESKDPRLLHSLVEVRMGLESWSAYLAAKNANEDDIARMRELLEEMKRQKEKEGGWSAETDSEFHYAITAGTHNTLQLHVLNTIHNLFHASIKVALIEFYRKEGYVDVLHGHHTAILQAIIDRDPEMARAKMLEHLGAVEAKLAEMLEKNGGQA